MFSIPLSFLSDASAGLRRPVGVAEATPLFYRNQDMYIPPFTCSTVPVT